MLRRYRPFSTTILSLCAIAFLAAATQAQTASVPVASRFGLHLRTHSGPSLVPGVKAQALPQTTPNFSFGWIEFPRTPDSTAQGINSRGDIVGLYGPNLPIYHGTEQSFVLEGNTYSTLVYPNALYTLGLGINKTRKIVGWYVGADNNAHAFLRKGKVYTNIDYPGFENTIAANINDAGEITGICYQNTTGTIHGFVLKKGLYSTLDPPGSIYTEATGINSSGTVVGSYLDQNQLSHGFIFQNGQFTTVDYPGSDNTQLTGINDQGQMVGGYGDDVIIGGEDWTTPNAFFLDQGTFTPIQPPVGDVQVTWTDTLNGSQFVGWYVDSLGNIFGYEAQINAAR